MAFLNSFSELAQVFGTKQAVAVKEKKKKHKAIIPIATFANVEMKCGLASAQLWKWLQEQESCKKYGPKGSIMHSLADLKAISTYSETEIAECVVALIANGFARPSTDGNHVKAA